jgi:hypothetical protein
MVMESEKIQNLLNTAIYFLETIDDDNFDYKMQKLSQIAQEIISEKRKLGFESSNSEFYLSDNFIADKAKLLKEKFDDVIRKKKSEQNKISLQLQQAENQKKLAIYNR